MKVTLHRDLSADLDWGGVNQQEEGSGWGERQSDSNRNKGTLSTSAHKEPEANMVKSFYFWQQCYLAALFWGHRPVKGVRGLVERENWCEALGWPYTPGWTRLMAFLKNCWEIRIVIMCWSPVLIQYILNNLSFILTLMCQRPQKSCHSWAWTQCTLSYPVQRLRLAIVAKSNS